MTSPFNGSFTCGPTQDLGVVATGNTGVLGVSSGGAFFRNLFFRMNLYFPSGISYYKFNQHPL